jgi:two-component system cell cycle response regulator
MDLLMGRHGPEADSSHDLLSNMEPTQVLRLPARRTPSLVIVRVQFGTGPFKAWIAHPGSSGTIGRASDADLVVQDPSVSRYHARIEVDSAGELVLVDQQSTNGTTVNDQPVDGQMLIRPGDRVVVGAVSLLVEKMSPAELEQLKTAAYRVDSAHLDPLTGLVTRRWLDTELAGFIDRFQRVGEPITCVFIDLDHFKQINDRHGHGVGDQVLKGTGAAILRTIREQDVAVRFGGDELVVFLARCGADQAVRVSERFRKALSELSCPGLPAGNVKMTAGVAEYQGESPSQWLERADAALYRAKRAGRDRTST